MAEYSMYTETQRRLVYSLALPTNWVEVEKVLSSIRNRFSGETWTDDFVEVTSDDEHIKFIVQLDTKTTP